METSVSREEMDTCARRACLAALEKGIAKNRSVLAGIAKMQTSDFSNFLNGKRSIPETAYLRLALKYRNDFNLPLPSDITEQLSKITTSQGSHILNDYFPIPIRKAYGSMGGGSPEGGREAVSFMSIKVDYLRHKTQNLSKLSFIRGEGDSMIPTIPANALVLIDESQKDIQTGKIYYLIHKNEYFIKRVFKNHITGKITYVSDKDQTVVEVGEQDHFEIIGLALMAHCEL